MRLAIAIVMACSLGGVLPSMLSAQPARDIGIAATVVNGMDGTVSSQRRNIGSGDRLFANEVVETAKDGKGQLLFLDETSLTVGPASRLTLDKFVFDPDASRSVVSMTAVKGVFRFVSGSLPKQAYEIKTPAGVVGVRGTIFDLIVLANGDVILRLVEGGLVFTTLTGQQLEVNRLGQVLTVTKAGVGKYATGLDGQQAALLAPILDLAGSGGGQVIPTDRANELRDQLRDSKPTPNND
ncbi:MAG: FecR domain-containing protein [Rhodospirillales bacterium]